MKLSDIQLSLIIVAICLGIIGSSLFVVEFWHRIECDKAVSALATIQLCEMNAKCTFDIEAARTFMESIKTRDQCESG